MNRTLQSFSNIYIMNTLNATSQLSIEDEETLQRSGRRNKGKLHALLMLIFWIVFFIVYSLPSKYYQLQNSQEAMHEIPFLILCTVFPILGFGLLLSSYTYLRLSGMFIALFVVCMNFLLGPILHHIWFLAFSEGNSFVENGEKYIQMVTDNSITPTNLTFKLCNLCSVSFLIAMSGIIGRITISGIFQLQLIFNLLWYLNLNINIYFIDIMEIQSLTYFDDYGTTYVYLFGACYGLLISFFNKTPKMDNEIQSDYFGSIYSLLGTAFLFCTFAFTSTDIISYTSEGIFYHLSVGASSVWFSMIGSIVGIYCGSFMINNEKVGVKEASFGVVIGAVMSGASAGFIENIGGCLAIGFIAGFITAILMNSLIQYFNDKDIVDSTGFIIPILLTGFLGTFAVFPMAIITHYNEGNTQQIYSLIKDQPVESTEQALFQLMHCAFTIFISLLGSFLGIFIARFAKEEFSDFLDFKIFAYDYGLHQVEEENTSLNDNENQKDGEKEKKEQKSDKSAKADEI